MFPRRLYWVLSHPQGVFTALTLAVMFCWATVSPLGSGAVASPPPTAGSLLSVWGRDTWVPAGTSRTLRLIGSEDLVSPGAQPTIIISPGPVTVHYVLAGTPRDLTFSISVPADAPPGFQALEVSDGTITHALVDAIRIVDATIPNPTPSVLPLGGSATLTFVPHPLFEGQSSFSLDLGPEVAVGPISMEADGSLRAPVSVLNSALPGTRSVQLTAGPHVLLAERGFGIDFGPSVNSVHLETPGGHGTTSLDLSLPAGYTAYVFASTNSENRMFAPDEMYVDPQNRLYVLNQGLSFQRIPFSISMFDLNPANFGAFLGRIEHSEIDPTQQDFGVLESAAMLPSRPGKLFVSTEEFASSGFPGGRRIYEIDVATRQSRVWLDNPDWQLDPINLDFSGNLAVAHGPPVAISLLNPEADVIKTCEIVVIDAFEPDVLTGKYLVDARNSSVTLDMRDCSIARRSTGHPQFDEGAFGPSAGDFGNGYYVAAEFSEGLMAMLPVAPDDPSTNRPERVVVIVPGFISPDTVWFDRDGRNLLVTDEQADAVIGLRRDPNFQPALPTATLSPTSLTFSNQLVGTSSAAQTITLVNEGTAPLTIAAITPSPPYSQTNNCGSSVAAGASCAINVTFTPAAGGSRAGTLSITDNARGSPHTVVLSGTGGDFSLATAPGGSTSASISAGLTATYRLSIVPTGFVGKVSIACDGAPRAASCTSSRNPLTLDGVNPASFTIIVTTTARSMAPPGSQHILPPTRRHIGLPLLLWLMVSMTLLGIAAMPRQKGRVGDSPLQWARRSAPAFAAALLIAMWIACGGGGGGGNLGTPPGTYTLTVTATYTLSSVTLKRDIKLTLTVL